MHNVKRGSISAAKDAAMRKRAADYTALADGALAARRERRADGEALALCAQVLALNPEHATMWGWRKEACITNHPEPGPTREAALLAELELAQAGLMANPKSYCCWHHRRWAIEWGPLDAHMARELKLCDKLLALDARNFHCWQHRRWLAERAQVPPAELRKLVDSHIAADFSNYSAWHERTRQLPLAHDPVDPAELRAELELVRNAFYTAPDDSSAWFYHRWLLARAAAAMRAAEAAGASADLVAIREALAAELAMANELLELEPGAKWPQLTGARVCLLLGGEAELAQGREWLSALAASDAQRSGHYAELLRQLTQLG
ncbi:hypothetical protein T492DRAFT_941191 [Pavlovales sp. CCMP2436]|nr:hypothetical protein T492DRAFT_941191 [Pavlovales sp. CCMP2436]